MLLESGCLCTIVLLYGRISSNSQYICFIPCVLGVIMHRVGCVVGWKFVVVETT